jgi:hypothetical protein
MYSIKLSPLENETQQQNVFPDSVEPQPEYIKIPLRLLEELRDAFAALDLDQQNTCVADAIRHYRESLQTHAELSDAERMTDAINHVKHQITN